MYYVTAYSNDECLTLYVPKNKHFNVVKIKEMLSEIDCQFHIAELSKALQVHFYLPIINESRTIITQKIIKLFLEYGFILIHRIPRSLVAKL